MNFNIEKKYIQQIGCWVKNESQKDINIRCPICGDSLKNKYKARGFITKKEGYDGAVYTCYNDCGTMSFYKFLEETLGKDSAINYLNEIDDPIKKFKAKSTSDNLSLFTQKPKEESSYITYQENEYRLIELTQEALGYIEQRKVDVDSNWKSVEGLDCIYFPLKESSNKIYGYQLRWIDFKKFHNHLEDENNPNVYNYDKVKNLPEGSDIYVFESIFNLQSVGLKNSIAVIGANVSEKTKELLKKFNLVFCLDNDNAGIWKMIKFSSEGYDCIVYGEEWPKGYDWNDLKKKGASSESLRKYIEEHKEKAKMANYKMRMSF